METTRIFSVFRDKYIHVPTTIAGSFKAYNNTQAGRDRSPFASRVKRIRGNRMICEACGAEKASIKDACPSCSWPEL